MSESRKVVLRDLRDSGGTRHLEAALTASGDLQIEGQDLGDAVEDFFGSREYEWSWTIRAPHVADLLRALDAQGDPLAALEKHFSGSAASDLKGFLEDRSIPHETWSRLGD